MEVALQILLEDNHCIAAVKPAALLTQAPAGVPSFEAMVKAYIREKHLKAGNVYLGVPHRLDRPVSGVMLFARNSKAAQRLAEQFRERQVTKVYWGVIEGTLAADEGVWEDCVRKVPDEARAEIVAPNTPDGKQAVMRYRVLERLPLTPDPSPGGRGEKCTPDALSATLVEFQPVTGRMHQIRVQSAARGHPLLGDALYGSQRPFGPQAELPRDRLIALHARSLTFLHPLRYESITLTAPLSAYWRDSGVAVE